MKTDKQLNLWGGGDGLKEAGLDSVEMSNSSFVAMMRNYAESFVGRHGVVSTDDLRKYAQTYGVRPAHSNAWGSIFRGSKWAMAGRVKSKLASNHAREIRLWKLAQ